MKDLIKKLVGLDKEEEQLKQERAKVAEQEEALTKVSDPKAYATRKKQPWVGVLDVKVNEENVRNGFFELDWNKYFIKQLIDAGYGVTNDPDEEIVDRWFRDVVGQILDEEGMDSDRGSGYINVVPISKGKSEIS